MTRRIPTIHGDAAPVLPQYQPRAARRCVREWVAANEVRKTEVGDDPALRASVASPLGNQSPPSTRRYEVVQTPATRRSPSFVASMRCASRARRNPVAPPVSRRVGDDLLEVEASTTGERCPPTTRAAALGPVASASLANPRMVAPSRGSGRRCSD
jgi:hypothetical protein